MKEAASAKAPRGESSPSRRSPSVLLLKVRPAGSRSISLASRLYRSLIYAVIVFISFFLMLVFMTYNVRNDAHAKVECGC